MASSPTLISDTTKHTLAELLKQKAKSPKPLTVGQLIGQQKATIRKMYGNGHSWDAITAVLGEHNLTVSTQTVEALLARKKKGDKNKEISKVQTAEAEQIVSQAQFESIIAEWERLSHVRVGFTKQELVAAMSEEISAALAAGYLYSDLVPILEIKGVKIAVGSLRKYHRAALNRQPINSGKGKKTAIATSQSTDTPLNASELLTDDDIFVEGFDNA